MQVQNIQSSKVCFKIIVKDFCLHFSLGDIMEIIAGSPCWFRPRKPGSTCFSCCSLISLVCSSATLRWFNTRMFNITVSCLLAALPRIQGGDNMRYRCGIAFQHGMETTKMLETNFVIVSLETDVSLLSITSLQSFKCEGEGAKLCKRISRPRVSAGPECWWCSGAAPPCPG